MWRSVVSAACLLFVVQNTPPERPNARDLAVRLAMNAVSAGVVVPEADLRAIGPAARPDRGGAPTFQKELPQFLAAFNARQAHLLAAMTPNGVLVEGTNIPAHVHEILNRQIDWPEAAGNAGDTIFRQLMGLLRGRPVTAIAGIGAMPGPSCGLEQPVRIPKGLHTVKAVLNAVAHQVPGLVWTVTYRPDTDLSTVKIGVVCATGESLRMSVFQ